MQFNLTKYQENQEELLDPILQQHYWKDDGNMTKVIVSHLGVTPDTHTLRHPSHNSFVTACTISSTDEFIVAGYQDGTIHIFDTATGNWIRTLQGHRDRVQCIRVLSNDAVISASWDRTLRLWDTATGKCIRTFVGHTRLVHDCCAASTDIFMVSASMDHTLKLWNIATGACTQTLTGHTHGVTACCISSTNTFIVSRGVYGTTKLWDVMTGICTMTLHHNAMTTPHGCCLDSADQYIISTDSNDTLKVWDVATGTCTHTLPDFGHSIILSTDGQRIVGSYNAHGMNFLRTWNKETGEIRTKEIHGCDLPYTTFPLCISSDDQFLVCGYNGEIRIRETDTLDLYHHN